MYSNQSISLDNIYIPGGATEEFKKRVMMLRYLVTSRHSEGNTEFIWGVSKDDDYTPSHCMMPWRVLKKNNGTWVDGYNLSLIHISYEFPAKGTETGTSASVNETVGCSCISPLTDF